ncbi:transcriptional regulator [Salinicola endophyticus]|uniref:Transcriptional regulator n=1 Tax=Salinicola endophyticus TaxID=1949083 RepID=A0ABY8FFU9_9GAMM|nr:MULTISPECIES: helix-turn-helix domain-containing protein [Salinicola]WFF41687.1 transcriptional regulator [Salinicola endophyticus]
MKVSEEPDLCPIARALACVGDSWTLLILRDAFQGATRFDQFQRGLGIASNMLTRRLERMVDNGLLEKHRYQTRPPRFEYRLTDKGRGLAPVLLTLYAWGEHHLPIAARGVELVHRDSGEPIVPVIYDRHQGTPLVPRDVVMVAGPDATPAMRQRAERARAQGEILLTSVMEDTAAADPLAEAAAAPSAEITGQRRR